MAILPAPTAGAPGVLRSPERSPAVPGAEAIPPALRQILYHASLAPSGHNAQPWRVELRGESRVLVTMDTRGRLPAVDPLDREAVISLGAFLENLVVAAGVVGLRAELEPAEDAGIAAVRLAPSRDDGGTFERIRARRTVRSGQATRPLKAAHLATLVAALGQEHAFFPRGSAEARYLEEGTIEANRVQASRQVAQEELAEWIRWSAGDARRHRDGLTPASMEMRPPVAFYARHFMSRESVLTDGFREKTVQGVRKQVAGGGGWLVVTSPDGSPGALLETGRRLERALLLVRELGIGAHPMTQMLEEEPFRGEVGRSLGLSAAPRLLLRVGYVDRYPDPVSPRRPVAWFTTHATGDVGD